MNRDGKGAKEENRKPTFAFFFKSFFRKFPQMLRLNIMMLLQILPLIAAVAVIIPEIYTMILYFMGDIIGENSPTVTDLSFAPLYGMSQISSVPNIAPALDMSSLQMGIPVFSPVVRFVGLGIFLFYAITWGWQNVGATYVLRGLVRGDAVFVFSDFFYGIKRNLKQGFFLGLLDFLFCAIIGFNYSSLLTQTGTSFGVNVMFFMTLALMIIYFIMRFYIYLLLVTFDLKNTKIIKNALIFTILGIKRNLLAFLGIILLVGLHIGLILMLVPSGISLPLIIPVVYIMAATAFMSAYAAYPVIDKYMIESYADNSDNEEFVYFGENSEDDSDKFSDVE
jgi:uncharacterized membrane protein YesL